MRNPVTSVVIAGLGGQGVLKASDILGDAVFRAGHDVKKAEVHGMSQRGGSVNSDVRFGPRVFSPMVPFGEADFLVVLTPDQLENNRGYLKPGGVLIEPAHVDATQLENKRSLNVAMLGCLSRHLELPEACWRAALEANLPPALLDANLRAFALGCQTGPQPDPASPVRS
jgi:indolepyruvate ferredoxin oxidoreductase beta subunit